LGVKLRAFLLVVLVAVALGATASHATIDPCTLTVTVSASSASAPDCAGTSIPTVYYNPSAGGSFTVTVTATTDAPPLTIDFPTVFGDDPAPGTATSHTYTWTSSATDSGTRTVIVADGDDTKSPKFAVTPDTPTVSNDAPTELSGGENQYWSSAANTLWFRPDASGSFRLNATATDRAGAIAKVDFPDVSAVTGWSGSTGGSDTSSPYSSPTVYAWTAGATAPGAKQLTATSTAGLTVNAPITIGADAVPPTGQAIALAGGPWFAGSVALTITPGTDAGSGVNTGAGVVERATAPLSHGACGAFGAFTAVTLSGNADTGVSNGFCYRYQYKTVDNVGNVSTASTPSADARVDATPPAAPLLSFNNFDNTAAVGSVVYFRPNANDRFTVTAISADAESGIASYTFASTPGFTVLGSGAIRAFSFTGSSSISRGPFAVSAVNSSGLSSPSAAFTLAADPSAPTVGIRCNGKPCHRGPYAKGVRISLTARDSGGSGVDAIRFTVDGSAPTAEHGAAYQSPFVLTRVARLRVRAFDKVGNGSPVSTMTIRSLANRLSFAAPASLRVGAGARYLATRVVSSRRAMATVTMTGPKLKKARRWRFVVGQGASIVRFKLPQLASSGRYTIRWTVRAGTWKVARTTHVVLRTKR
jgi:hypothetical protein